MADVKFVENGARPVSASWKGIEGQEGTVSFDFLIDASGRRGLLSTKYLHNRQFNQSLKNIATWAYWSGTGSYKPDTPRAGSPFFEALGGMWLDFKLLSLSNQFVSRRIRVGMVHSSP